jgi:hypothetical protein
MFPRFVSCFISLVCLFAAAHAEPPPANRFEKEIAVYEAADKVTPPPQGAVVFTGASSIRLWKTLAADFPAVTVVNRGFGGTQLADSAFFAERIVIPYHPKTVVIQAGGNDINAGKSPEQVLADFQAWATSSDGPARGTSRVSQPKSKPVAMGPAGKTTAGQSTGARLHREREEHGVCGHLGRMPRNGRRATPGAFRRG